jgi:hypothetical protein
MAAGARYRAPAWLLVAARRMQLLSHGTGPSAPGHVAMPLPDATSRYHDIDTAPKAEVFTG